MNTINDIRVTKITHVFSPYFEKGEKMKMENRLWYGLSFSIDGEIVYNIDGKKIVSDSKHAIFLPKGRTYTLECTKSGAVTLVNFQCEGFKFSDFLRIEISNPESFLSDHQLLERLDYHNKPYNRAKFLSVFYSILSRVAEEDPHNPYPVLRPAVKYIRQDPFNSELSVKTLAQKTDLSEVYFRKLFKLSYGVSPKQYILQLRINKAKELLNNDDYSISKIAEKCGCSNVYHFSKIFKEKVGCTPSEYRKAHRYAFF